MGIQMIEVAPQMMVGKSFEYDLSDLITENDEPVDNFPSSKQQRFFVEPIYSSSKLQSPFLADCNIAIYSTPKSKPLVPDMFLSMGVQVAHDWWEKANRSYLLWEFSKPPEVVVEIVSNNKGNEDEQKLQDYAEIGVLYYVIYDPQEILSNDIVRVYQLVAGEYLLRPDYRLSEVGLSLTFWYGVFEGKTNLWLRWCDFEGNIIPTGAERAQQEHNHAERERQRADREYQRAERERQQAQQAKQQAEDAKQQAENAKQQASEERKRTEFLLAQLRALGVEPQLPE